jgi:hypothetical protein
MSKPGLPSLDEKLDEALKETFPASDAFALFPEVSNGPVELDSQRLLSISIRHLECDNHGFGRLQQRLNVRIVGICEHGLPQRRVLKDLLGVVL